MPNRRATPPPPKRIVYLWGAGATQAEVSYRGGHRINLLMRDSEELGEGIATRILGRLPKLWRPSFVTDQGMDIEKLISLLTACNVSQYLTLAERLRKLYFEDICSNLAVTNVLSDPQLAVALLTLHSNTAFQEVEELHGIITTNHDGILQLAYQRVYEQLDIGIPFLSSALTPATDPLPPLVHLHGSFTWTFGLPTNVTLLTASSKYSPNTVWIPPTILKESKSYPFNTLAGKAYELLSRRCDVLRIVGSALTQNDWHILSMLFNAQRHNELTKGQPFRIELIMPHAAGLLIVRDCSYLKNLTPIGFLSDGEFAVYKDDAQAPLNEEQRNPLFYWLKQKISFHQQRSHLGPLPLHPAIATVAGDAQ
jgi:hypothetical protein